MRLLGSYIEYQDLQWNPNTCMSCGNFFEPYLHGIWHSAPQTIVGVLCGYSDHRGTHCSILTKNKNHHYWHSNHIDLNCQKEKRSLTGYSKDNYSLPCSQTHFLKSPLLNSIRIAKDAICSQNAFNINSITIAYFSV